jgi:enoyl-[acyl-carrier protein] reductase III
MSLERQIILITGGSRGIGRAIALRLAREQPEHVAICYCLNHAAARQTVADLQALGVSASAVATDVGKSDLIYQMFEQIEHRFGRLDIFISNAARTSFQRTMELNERNWQKILDLNARSFLLGAQCAARLMRANGGGRIIGISSLGSRFYTPGYAALGAAKAMMENLVRYLAFELAPWGINTNAVCGGFIDTESMRLAPDYREITEYIRNRTPVKRLGRPEDLAGVVALLCSPDSDWIRGQTLVVDGGFSLSL